MENNNIGTARVAICIIIYSKYTENVILLGAVPQVV